MTTRETNRKRRKKKGLIHPESDDQELFDNMEMDSLNNIDSARDKFKLAAKLTGPKKNVINIITDLKSHAQRWKNYVTSRRTLASTEESGQIDRRRTGGIGLDTTGSLEDRPDGTHMDAAQREIVTANNRNLIEYFARKSKEPNGHISLEYLDSTLQNGARIDCTDKFGQTVLHEVARAWHVDVARYLIEEGANVNHADSFGRTALHVASAVDYPEMVEFLIANGADKEFRTKNELQTPVHYAARSDACQSLRALIEADCEYKEVRDFKGRTPLHVAAELDRSETARFLLELDDSAPAGVEDNSGQAAIVWMIQKMPLVAALALDQFHTTDRANRKQYFHLNRLEPKKRDDPRPGFPQKAMQVVVNYRRFDLILHPVFEDLINVKWKRFGRFGALFNLVKNLLFILAWTCQGILVEYNERHFYDLPSQWWRIMLFCIALLFTVWQLKDELYEFYHSKRIHAKWKNWREEEIQRDSEHAHPRWPEEKKYLLSEEERLDKQRPQYFNDFWNIFDWICYMLLLTCILTHIVDVSNHTHVVARLHIRIMAITIILLWLRLMKNARAFSLLGPFIVMISHMASDVMKFGFLYLEFYIPYACAFWMIFGDDKVPQEYQGRPDANNHTMTVNGLETPSALLFSLFRLTLVDEYDYDGMKAVDSIMADLLIGTWLALSAILMLNIFIALMSDTFQRVYDNAKANAVMQKAITILSIEEGLSFKKKNNFRDFIHGKCCPREDEYDDDSTEAGEEDLKKVTFLIKDQLDDLQAQLKENHMHFGNDSDDDDSGNGDEKSQASNKKILTNKRFEDEISTIHDQMDLIRLQQEESLEQFKKESQEIKSLLVQLVRFVPGASTAVHSEGLATADELDRSLADSSTRFRPHEIASTAVIQSGGLAHAPGPPRYTWGAPEDHEWADLERRRREDLAKLRSELHHQPSSSQLPQHSTMTIRTSAPRTDSADVESTATTTDVHIDAPAESENLANVHFPGQFNQEETPKDDSTC